MALIFIAVIVLFFILDQEKFLISFIIMKHFNQPRGSIYESDVNF